ncbi:MAG: polysaccharide deacetylase family protein [Chthoniobacterales bacterium]|nr:polysaccharide deacetylase family protein [Chthoniobacterales bacterium]
MFFIGSDLKASLDFMVKRLTIFLLLGGLAFGGCKKGSALKKNTPLLNPSPAPSVAIAAVPTPVPTPAKPAIDQNAQVIVFGYHRFEKKVRRPDTEIMPEAFEAQMKMLQERKIPVIGMQDFLAWKRGEKSIPTRAAIITIDDGYKSGYEVAWPILKKYGYPFTVFIYTEGIKPGRYSGGESMSWEQLAEMRDAGVDIQSHTETHQDLRKPPFDRLTKHRLSQAEYEPWLENEVGRAKKTIEDKLGVKVDAFAVPYGYYNQHVKEVAAKAGYEALFTVYGQKLTYGSPNDSLGRYMIEANKPKVFTDAISFGGATTGGSEPVEGVPTASLQAQPADGAIVNEKTPLIQANLGGLATLDAGSVQLRVSGLGLVPSKFDPQTKIVSYQVTQPLHGDSCTVILTAKSGGKKVEAHWSFTLKEGAVRAKDAPGLPSGSPKK